MRPRLPGARRGQRGFSLVSMMVGLTLSLVSIVALMMAYRGLGQSSLRMVANTRWESQGAALSVALPRLIQQAGWGAGASVTPRPGGAANTDVVLLGTSTLTGTSLTGTASVINTTAQAGSALVWSTAVTGSVQCWALVASGGGVALLGPTACSAASGWSGLTWAQRVDLAPVDSFTPRSGLPAFEIQAATGTCWPYGGNGTGGQPAVIVTLIERQLNQVSATPVQTQSVCLSNIPN